MADFLREIRDISILNFRRELKRRSRDSSIKAAQAQTQAKSRGGIPENEDGTLPDITVEYPPEKGGAFIPADADNYDDTDQDASSSYAGDGESIRLSLATYDEQDLGGSYLVSRLLVWDMHPNR